jgi:hypothetical protein
MAGLVPAIHDLICSLATKTSMPATSAGMTGYGAFFSPPPLRGRDGVGPRRLRRGDPGEGGLFLN